jgi:hypothetical protein
MRRLFVQGHHAGRGRGREAGGFAGAARGVGWAAGLIVEVASHDCVRTVQPLFTEGATTNPIPGGYADDNGGGEQGCGAQQDAKKTHRNDRW